MPLRRREHRAQDPARCVDEVKDVLARKWHDDTTRNDPQSPWVRLDEVVYETGLTQIEALRALKMLTRESAFRVLHEPADRKRRQPAKWVFVLDCHDRLGLPAVPHWQGEIASVEAATAGDDARRRHPRG